jgi:hypothetical protein
MGSTSLTLALGGTIIGGGGAALLSVSADSTGCVVTVDVQPQKNTKTNDNKDVNFSSLM